MMDDEQIAALRAALLELREDEREVFLLRQNGDLTYEQIAAGSYQNTDQQDGDHRNKKIRDDQTVTKPP